MFKSNFYWFAKKNSFFVLDNEIFMANRLKNMGDYFEPSMDSIKLNLFEEIYFSDLEKTHSLGFFLQNRSMFNLANYVVNQLSFGKKYKKINKEECLIKKLIQPTGMLFNKGCVFSLLETNQGKIKIKNRKFLAIKPSFSIDNFEESYKKEIHKEVKEIKSYKTLCDYIKKGEHFNEDKNLGFKIAHGSFFVYSKTGKYELFERENKKRYLFEDAKVGSRLVSKGDKILWDKLLVINSYSHPALPELNKPFQKICVGEYNYNKLKKLPIEEQISNLLFKGIKALTKEYIQTCETWHNLIEPIFEIMEIL